jgi:hypothetical protein
LEANAPKRVTAAMLNDYAETHTDQYPEFDMALHQTGINMGVDVTARVRLVNLTDKALVGAQPVEVRKLIQKLFFSNTPQRRGNAGPRMEEQMQRMKEVGYAYGVAGFVSPRLVLRKEEIRDPENEAWVGSIALHDLMEFTRICEGDDQLAKRRLAGFPGGSA